MINVLVLVCGKRLIQIYQWIILLNYSSRKKIRKRTNNLTKITPVKCLTLYNCWLTNNYRIFNALDLIFFELLAFTMIGEIQDFQTVFQTLDVCFKCTAILYIFIKAHKPKQTNRE